MTGRLRPGPPCAVVRAVVDARVRGDQAALDGLARDTCPWRLDGPTSEDRVLARVWLRAYDEGPSPALLMIDAAARAGRRRREREGGSDRA